MLGDLNGCIGDKVRASITGAFELQEKNDNGKRVMELCDERGLCVGNMYFEHKSDADYKGGKGPR